MISMLQQIHILHGIQTHAKHCGSAVARKHHKFEEKTHSFQHVKRSDLAGSLTITHSSSTSESDFFKILVVCTFIPTKELLVLQVFFLSNSDDSHMLTAGLLVTSPQKSKLAGFELLYNYSFVSPPNML